MEQQPGPYHVFINHRGPDVKKGLASLIYNRLTNCHRLRVFLDKDEIRTGDTISNAIHTAIQSAYVHITFFSERYAESWWCLEELYWILRSYHKHNRKVIPVFCGVQPADLRHIESGCYKNAFDQHQSKGRVSTEDITKWKKTLSEAADISGIFFKPSESDYGEILEDIVRKVLEEVFKWGSLYVAKCPVGLDHVAEHPLINKILKQSDVSDTMIVGIAGMSGIGKTTLAKYLYNLRRLSFNGKSCFLSNVRTKDLAKLQEKLLSDLLGYTQDLQDIDGIGKHLLRHCRILLVLDDVDHIDQIEGLIDIDSVGCGSLILITARDKDLLRRSSPATVLYDVKPLNEQHAQELFCQHAFRESKASEEFEDLVEKFLEICKGFPLALKVLGAHFVGKSDKDYWKRQLKRFSTTLHEDILQTLKVSYDALNGEDKEAFLDIGCFLVGEETELAIRVLEGLYGSNIVHSLERLHQKCLVDFHYDLQSDDEIECRKPEDPMIGDDDPSVKYRGYKLAMHDHLRELARHIVREEFAVWSTSKLLRVGSTNDIVELSKSHDVSQFRMRGIRTSKDERLSDFVGFRGECVHLFVLEFPVDLSSLLVSLKLSGELVWLRLRNFRFGSMPFRSFIRLPKLSVLELQGHRDNIEQFFQNFDLTSMDHNFNKPCSRLNELNISGMEYELPSTSSTSSTLHAGHSMKVSENYSSSAVQQGGMSHLLSFLKLTDLKYLCKMVLKNLSSLQSLPVNFGEVARLRHLDLSGCTNLTELPKSFSKLLHLQYLAFRGCRNLSIPPDILGRISTLEYVDFKGCVQLVALPEGIPHQRHLRYLNLLSTCLSQLPEEVEQLGSLKQLRIGSPELTSLPRSVANLRGLTELIVVGCRRLECLSPEGIVAPSIQFLAIDFCPVGNFSFQKDQRTMCDLRDLTLKRTSISEICMAEGVYPWLQTINLSENIQLKQVIALPSALVRVNLQDCSQLETLNLSSLVNLKFLNINGCIALETLSVRGLISVEEIEAERCWKLKRIEGLNSLKCLDCLKISTDNKIFWEDVCSFLKPAPGVCLPNFMLSGKVDDEMDEGQIQRNMFELQCFFHVESVNFVCSNTISTQDSNQRCWTLEFLIGFGYSPCGILCFITNDVGGYSFRVAFDYKSDKYSSSFWTSQGRESGGRRLHVFMWNTHSKWYKEYSKLVRRQAKSYKLWVSFDCDASVSELDKVLLGVLWFPMHDVNDSMSGVVNEIMARFAPKSS